jgi:hypothetical protein
LAENRKKAEEAKNKKEEETCAIEKAAFAIVAYMRNASATGGVVGGFPSPP